MKEAESVVGGKEEEELREMIRKETKVVRKQRSERGANDSIVQAKRRCRWAVGGIY